MKKSILTISILSSMIFASYGQLSEKVLEKKDADVFALAVVRHTLTARVLDVEAKGDAVEHTSVSDSPATPDNALIPASSEKAEQSVKKLAAPVANFAGTFGGKLNSAALKAHNMVFAKLEPCEPDNKFKVTRFNLLIQKPKTDYIQLTANGNELSSEMRAAMSSITPGTTVIFYNIIILTPEGTKQKLNSIALTAM